ncbi:SDR family NAD(P)-dependent oxidoreductase [Rhodococcus sp. SORGH_AS_0301]|uniref:SDR family NAD(P)-dependent oxidoreductase n=1 Tax=Rhodococcus sp. SORGH_AS_0301 TaxID=3041780 RepID=UPI002780A85E|nr:SDR family NAD(P)-dependent oxidoreductase [Rhodococcus sp. SORGH_AS_0301]MDQ1178586.1 3-oxoacyl-[acyl-carrier protein] reductase [Rhodococcus sp. SORGH_AS_0301]
MTSQDDFAQTMGFDRLPEHIIDKRVTDLMDLTGRKAIVTGAGGGGLGQAIANRLAGLGADVAVIDINGDGATHRAQEIERRWGTRAVPFQADLSDWDQVHDVVNRSVDALGGLDIMINNPVQVVSDAFENHTKADIDYTVHGSLTMLMYGAHAAIEHFLPQGRGRIVNIASVGGRIQHRGLTVYNASKSGVIGFTRNLAHEFALRGINVLGVAPGVMINPLLRDILANASDEQSLAAKGSMLEAVDKYIQLGRVSLPEEVANMVAYLSTEAADYMCGQTIDVAGGQCMN